MGKQRADERSCHAGNGEAANQTAHAGQELIVKHQFAADAEEKREDQPQKKAIFQRARRMLFKRGMHGIGCRQQEQRGQDAVSGRPGHPDRPGTRYGAANAAARTEKSVSRVERWLFRKCINRNSFRSKAARKTESAARAQGRTAAGRSEAGCTGQTDNSARRPARPVRPGACARACR